MERHRERVAGAAPKSAARETRAEIEARVLRTLRSEFAVPNLSTLPEFVVVLEGATDRGYIQRATELMQESTGMDPLEIPVGLRRRLERRACLIVPGEPGRTASGGVDRMVDLAGALFADYFGSEVPSGILFVFDHDWAGRKARDQVLKYGFRREQHAITLDPTAHASQQGRSDVVIEDLLPLMAQEAFFGLGGASCSLEYRAGLLTRIKWEHPSKAALRKHICAHSCMADFAEVVTLVSRIRAALGFPILGSGRTSQEQLAATVGPELT